MYYLLEKTDQYKNIENSKNKKTLIKKEEDLNEIEVKKVGSYSINRDVTIEDIMKFIKEETSNAYDLLEDNCQDFVKCLIRKYCK